MTTNNGLNITKSNECLKKPKIMIQNSPNANAKLMKWFQFQIQLLFQSDLQEFIIWYMNGVQCMLEQEHNSEWTLDLIVQLYNSLSELGLSRLFESELSEILYSQIELAVENLESLDANVEWLHECIFPLLHLFYSTDCNFFFSF